MSDKPHIDLFGNPISDAEAMEKTTIDKRLGDRATPAPIGSGPEGKTCRDCRFKYRRQGGSRYFWKCRYMVATNGGATDIRLRWAACSYFEQYSEEDERERRELVREKIEYDARQEEEEL